MNMLRIEDMNRWELMDRIEELETAVAQFRDCDMNPDCDLSKLNELLEHLYSLVPDWEGAR